MSLKRLVLARSTVLLLIASITAMVAIASLVPQSFLVPAAELEAWHAAHPSLGRLVEAAGLDHVYTHPAFAALLVLGLVALAFSTGEQLRTAWRRTRGGASGGTGTVLEAAAPPAVVVRALRRLGYLRMRTSGESRFLVRQPWGYWGNFLLHAGLALVVAASGVIGVTQQRSALHLVEGETYQRGGPWFAVQNGVAATRLVLPFDVRLDHLQYRFWPTYGLRSVTSTLALLRPGAPPQRIKVGIGDLQVADGVRIYQSGAVGHAFQLEVRRGNEVAAHTLLVEHPRVPAEAGFNEFRILGPGEVLRARYLVDAERRSFEVFNPVLVLRLDAPGGSSGEITLRPGTAADLGPYQVRLVDVRLWTRLFFVQVTGIFGVFAGFLVISLGGVLHYFTPPRELTVQPAVGGGTRLVWRAARFASFYEEELDTIRAAVASGETP